MAAAVYPRPSNAVSAFFEILPMTPRLPDARGSANGFFETCQMTLCNSTCGVVGSEGSV